MWYSIEFINFYYQYCACWTLFWPLSYISAALCSCNRPNILWTRQMAVGRGASTANKRELMSCSVCSWHALVCIEQIWLFAIQLTWSLFGMKVPKLRVIILSLYHELEWARKKLVLSRSIVITFSVSFHNATSALNQQTHEILWNAITLNINCNYLQLDAMNTYQFRQRLSR